MWNNWVEKAKVMAADIDHQLNEAVGADADPDNITSTTAAATTAAASSATNHHNSSAASAVITTATKLAVTQDDDDDDDDDDDVWNDDFDFDDDEKGNDAKSGNDSKVEQSKEDGSVLTAEIPPPVDARTPSAATTAAAAKDYVSPQQHLFAKQDVEAEPELSRFSSQIKEDAAIIEDEGETSPLPSSTHTAPAPVERQETSNDEPPHPSLAISALDETPAEAGWEEYGDDDIEISETNNEEEEQDPAPVVALPPASPPKRPSSPKELEKPSEPAEALGMASQPMFSSFGGGGGVVEHTESEVTPKEASTNDPGEGDGEKPPQSSAVGGIFSNIAHRAEGIAHRAEGGVSSLLTAAAHLTIDGQDESDKEKTADASENTLPSATISNLISAAAGAVENVADGRDEVKSENDFDADDDDEWDEMDVLDITEQDGVGEPIVASTKQNKEIITPVTISESTLSTPLEQDADVHIGGVATTPTKSTTLSPSADDSVERETESVVKESPMSQAPVATTAAMTSIGNIEDDPRYKQLQDALRQREDQLANKAEQWNELQNLMEAQEQDYKQKLQDTKEEAKKRIQRAKERCEAVESKLRLNSTSGSEDAAKQEQIISALREEGEALAMKQAAMEQAVRGAKGETRELRENLEDEIALKEKALEKVKSLEAALKGTKDSLSAARKGESQAGKLENDLMSARSDSETKANTILSLQQHIRELTSESKDLKDEIAKIRKSAAHEAQQEKTSMRREHNDLLTDLETKLRTTEREAGVREDALRHEVAELRKRWQDAVRRADGTFCSRFCSILNMPSCRICSSLFLYFTALSTDIQSSTAPLLRQLESMERQNRARSANWAELESRLRSELEESVIQNESLGKDRSDFKAKYTRFERMATEREDELSAARKTIEEQTIKLSKLERDLEKLAEEAERRQQEYEQVERRASEGVARVRSEMSQTVMESEERYRGQIAKLEKELKIEQEKRTQLEEQVEQLLENAGMMVGGGPQARETIRRESKPKKLRQAEGQAEILAGALGLGDSDDETDDDLDDFDLERTGSGDSSDGATNKRGSTTSINSFAALEQLTSRLKTSQVELESLRRSLRDSEKTRASFVEELAESRHAKEKLPLFEAKVQELAEENREMQLEILGLREDIGEVKEMYRAQLNLLVEEKVAQGAQRLGPDDENRSNGKGLPASTSDDNDAVSPEDPAVEAPLR
ncbi:MAG: hypothetical protein SGILL_000508 [Bacillariaceae sp.]